MKTTSTKSRDTLVATEDDCMLNEIYPTDQLPNFYLGPKAQASAHSFKVGTSATGASDHIDIDTDEPPVTEDSLVFQSSIQQILGEIQSLSNQQIKLQSQVAVFQA